MSENKKALSIVPSGSSLPYNTLSVPSTIPYIANSETNKDHSASVRASVRNLGGGSNNKCRKNAALMAARRPTLWVV